MLDTHSQLVMMTQRLRNWQLIMCKIRVASHPQYDRVKDSTTIWRTIQSESADICWHNVQSALDTCIGLAAAKECSLSARTYSPTSVCSKNICATAFSSHLLRNSKPLIPSTPHANSCIICRFLLIHNPTQRTRKKKRREKRNLFMNILRPSQIKSPYLSFYI